MKEATAKCLRDGFCSDSMAHTRYILYAQKANEESFPSIARLFRALAYSRHTRAAELYRLTGELIGTHTVCSDTYFTFSRTMDNLKRARNAESHEADEVLSAYAAVAEIQGEEGAAKSLKRSAVLCHQRAAILDSVFIETHHAAGEPLIRVTYVCKTCGMVIENLPEEACPVCGTDVSGFIAVE
ncbi:MAG: ferritin family protein [Methanocella sp.]